MECITQATLNRGTAQAFRLEAGDRIKIICTAGGQCADATFPGFHQALTRRINGTRERGRVSVITTATKGTILYDGAPEPVLEIVEDKSVAPHDILYPGCQAAKPGDNPGCRDLMSWALDTPLVNLPPAISFFMTLKDGDSVPSVAQAGDFVVLEAKRSVTFAVTSCPGPTSFAKPGPIRVEVYRG